jgi:hypothetical protein
MATENKGGASEAAAEAVTALAVVYDLGDGEARDFLAAAHDPALGLERSVNERWCREDQTRRIGSALQRAFAQDGAIHSGRNRGEYPGDVAEKIISRALREFGSEGEGGEG